MSGHHALVIGASGLIGWSVVNQLLQPRSSAAPFRKVSALVNRPLKLEKSFWPEQTPDRPELSLASRVNLLCEDEEFESLLKAKVEDVQSVSHVYYFGELIEYSSLATYTNLNVAFKEVTDDEKEVEVNVTMMLRVVRAVKDLSKDFKFFVYPGGTRVSKVVVPQHALLILTLQQGYGIYRPDGIFTPPLVEEMAEQLPEDYKKTVAYPHYRATLAKESLDQPWTWCELVPDAIIGFTPNGSGFSLAGHWAVYLYAYKLVHGEGAEVPYPGVMAGYDSLFSETSATTLARVAIHASLHPEQFKERIFNVADSAHTSTMRVRWPQITSFFNLKGVEPPSTASASDAKPSDFIKQHREKLEEAGVKGVEIWNAAQLDSYGYWLTFDRQLSLTRLREAGFTDESKPEEGWWEAFEGFKRAGMIG